MILVRLRFREATRDHHRHAPAFLMADPYDLVRCGLPDQVRVYAPERSGVWRVARVAPHLLRRPTLFEIGLEHSQYETFRATCWCVHEPSEQLSDVLPWLRVLIRQSRPADWEPRRVTGKVTARGQKQWHRPTR
jgi:hypothetical protein